MTETNGLETVRTADIVAAEINSIKDQTRKMVLSNSIEIGKRLCEAKEMVEHGQWGQWLNERVDYSQSTAQNLMKIFQEYGADQGQLWGAEPKSETFGKLSYSQAVVLLGVPAEEREAFAKGHDLEETSIRELKKEVEELKGMAAQKAEAEKKLEETKKKLKDEKATSALLKKELKEAEEGASAVKIKELEDKLKESAKKVAELEEEATKTIEAAIVEKIPEATEKELADLREKAKKLDLMSDDEAVAKYKAHFETLKNDFNVLMSDLQNIKDGKTKYKYKAASRKLLEAMEKAFDEAVSE